MQCFIRGILGPYLCRKTQERCEAQVSSSSATISYQNDSKCELQNTNAICEKVQSESIRVQGIFQFIRDSYIRWPFYQKHQPNISGLQLGPLHCCTVYQPPSTSIILQTTGPLLIRYYLGHPLTFSAYLKLHMLRMSKEKQVSPKWQGEGKNS